MKLAEHNRVQLTWPLGHRGIEDNETAKHLARLGSEPSFIGLEPASGISVGVTKKIARDWAETTKNAGSPSQDSNMQWVFYKDLQP
jgi:hypothetical protein